MRIIALETLKTMPNGTVFCTTDEWGNLESEIRILTGRFDNKDGFNGEIGLFPWVAGDENGNATWKMLDDNSKLITDKDFPTEWITVDASDHDYEPNKLFSVFSKKEVAKMIKALQWALSDLEDDFDMDEVLE